MINGKIIVREGTEKFNLIKQNSRGQRYYKIVKKTPRLSDVAIKTERSVKLKDIKAVHFDLYGVHLNEDILASNITYHGAFPPDEINNQLYSGFGLVWDGSSIEKCDGNTGEYLKYNNPHKLSLYLVSGIPVVIWKEAAEAKFVEEHGLGITVNSLDELGEKFASLSEEEYFEMVKNVAVVSNRLKNGYYLTQ